MWTTPLNNEISIKLWANESDLQVKPICATVLAKILQIINSFLSMVDLQFASLHKTSQQTYNSLCILKKYKGLCCQILKSTSLMILTISLLAAIITNSTDSIHRLTRIMSNQIRAIKYSMQMGQSRVFLGQIIWSRITASRLCVSMETLLAIQLSTVINNRKNRWKFSIR